MMSPRERPVLSEGTADDGWLRSYLEGQFSGLHNEIETLRDAHEKQTERTCQEIETLRTAQKATHDLLTLEGPSDEPCLMAQVRENTSFRKSYLERAAHAHQTRIGFVISLVLLAVSTALNLFWAWARGQAPQ